MSNPIQPTPGRIVWYRGGDGAVRAAIVAAVHGPFCLNLQVFGLNPLDVEAGYCSSVTHADPEQEPGCFPSWHWMPYQKQQAEKHATETKTYTDGMKATGLAPLPDVSPAGAPALQPHQQRVIDEEAELDERFTKLHSFIGTATFDGLDRAEQDRLLRQADVMAKYLNILRDRIAAFAPAHHPV